jgi:hypothetical protein
LAAVIGRARDSEGAAQPSDAELAAASLDGSHQEFQTPTPSSSALRALEERLLNFDDELGLLQLVAEPFLLELEPPDFALEWMPLLGFASSLARGQGGEPCRITLFLPLVDVRPVEAFPTKERRALGRVATLPKAREDGGLVGGGEATPTSLLGERCLRSSEFLGVVLSSHVFVSE